MTKATLRQVPVPILLFLCIVLGGSSQSIWGVLLLQIFALAMIGWAAISWNHPHSPPGRSLLSLTVAMLLLILIQLVPLPPSLWTMFPGREFVQQGSALLGEDLAWRSHSLDPHATLGMLLFFLPATATLLAILQLENNRISWLLTALFSGTGLGILLGYIQVITGRFGNSSWYLYEHTNLGSAVGFFANRNHMGTLLLVAVPFLLTFLFAGEEEDSRRAASRRIMGVAGVGAILLAIAVNGSLAAVALAIPVLAASALLVPSLRRFRSAALTAAGVGLLGAIIFLANSPVQPKLTGASTSSFETRSHIWLGTSELVQDTFPVGTGLGTFEKVFAQAAADEVSRQSVNHAHNDYIELLLETGVAGLLLMLAFLAWWLRQAVRAFSAPHLNRFAAAATIASGAILAHSVVDYPLRTAAIATVFAFCLALMAMGRIAEPSSENFGEKRRARHIKIG